jgi:hypothetical protein
MVLYNKEGRKKLVFNCNTEEFYNMSLTPLAGTGYENQLMNGIGALLHTLRVLTKLTT